MILAALTITLALATAPAVPIKSDCNIGKLVKAVETHIKLGHPEPDISGSIFIGASLFYPGNLVFQTAQNIGSCSNTQGCPPAAPTPGTPSAPTPKEGDEFMTWEVCGDEFSSLGSYVQTSDLGFYGGTSPGRGVSIKPEDPKVLRERADCIERRNEKAKRQAAYEAKKQKAIDDALSTLKAEVLKCSGGKR